MASNHKENGLEHAVEEIAKRARAAALELASLSSEVKDKALISVRQALEEKRNEILEANRSDKAKAEQAVAAGSLSTALLKRLDLEGHGKFDGVLQGIDEVKALPDPVGRVSLAKRLDDGLDLFRVSSPIGVICMIFEARPDAAVQIASLTLKSSNAVILKGGREAATTNKALVEAIRTGLSRVPGFPIDAVQFVFGREEVHTLLSLDRYIDLVIPRGSKQLVRSIQDGTRIPVLGHADGICAVYMDASADAALAAKIVVDAKTHYPAACNAAETLLVHRSVLYSVFPKVAAALREAKVALRCDVETLAALGGPSADVTAATAADYDTEFLELTLAVKTVGTVHEAIAHINEHGSHHTDAIITADSAAAEEFLSRVDSSSVYHNCSTRFADGQRYGFGAEVGISTNKTHARGPVGVEGLLIYKYKLYGHGQIVASYGGTGGRKYKHESIPFETYPGASALAK